MAKFIFISITLALTTPALAASAPPPGMSPLSQDLAHGGGCRKDSPPGRCCHAGSEPYHCH